MAALLSTFCRSSVTASGEEGSVVSSCETGEVQGGKSVCKIINPASLRDQAITASVYISPDTKPSGGTLTVRVQRHKDLMEHKDLAHAARGFVAAVTF